GTGTDELAPARNPQQKVLAISVRGIYSVLCHYYTSPAGAGHALRPPTGIARADLRTDRRPGHVRRRVRRPGAGGAHPQRARPGPATAGPPEHGGPGVPGAGTPPRRDRAPRPGNGGDAGGAGPV